MPEEISLCRARAQRDQEGACDPGTSYELRFAGLFNPGRGYSFPCDADGRVDIDALAARARLNYFYARTVIGREVRAPVVEHCAH
jgi:hypothetical protein